MNTEAIPSCEWPDKKRPATFHNCCDKDDRLVKELQRRAAENRIAAITKQLDCTHGLMSKKRSALWHERDRFERMFKLGKYSPVPVGKIDERKDKAEEEKLRWLGKKKGRFELI
jgi:hypothetical protein